MISLRSLSLAASVAGFAALGLVAAPGTAHAWWRGGGVGIGVVLPPVVVAPGPVYVPPPPVYYAPPPVVYAPPPYGYAPARRVWVPPHWEGPYWVRGHWS